MKKAVIIIGIILIIGVFIFIRWGLNGEFSDANLDVPRISVTSESIVDGGLITATLADKKPNNPRGKNHSPEVTWSPVEGANYYAVIIFDESANWLHFFETNITDTMIEEGKYTDTKTYIGPYPPKSSGAHTYRIEVFAIKEQPTDPIGKIDSRESYSGIVNHLNQVGGNSDNILARGYVKGTYENKD